MANYVLDYGNTVSGLPVFTLFRNINTYDNLLVTNSGVVPTLTALTSGYTTFQWSSGCAIHFRAEVDANFIIGFIDQTRGEPPQGEGSVGIDHDYGGIDNYQILHRGTGAPLDDAFIYIYLKSDFDADNVERPTYVKGQTITDVNGRWESKVWLDPGVYTAVVISPTHPQVVFDITVT
jgi:hypothetical protein